MTTYSSRNFGFDIDMDMDLIEHNKKRGECEKITYSFLNTQFSHARELFWRRNFSYGEEKLSIAIFLP